MNLSDLDPDIYLQAAEFLFEQKELEEHAWHSQYTCNCIDTIVLNSHIEYGPAEPYRKFYQDLYGIGGYGQPSTMRDGILWNVQPSGAVNDATAYPVRLLALCFAAAVLEWEQETAVCTLCAAVESEGFYTGCMIRDGVCTDSDWQCDGQGHLTRINSNHST